MTEAEPVYVAMDGGPLDGDLSGLWARALRSHEPPFLCASVDGVYEHYVAAPDCECGGPCYGYAGPCDNLHPHPPCGHAHGPRRAGG